MIPGMGGDARQMAMMMRKLGIQVQEIDDVQEVVIRTPSKDYVFSKASVSMMKAQGVETWQVSGKPRVVDRTAPGATAATGAPSSGSVLPPRSSPSATVPAASEEQVLAEEPTPYEPSGEDVALVARETGKPAAAARQALVEANGDLAEAILRLQA